MKRNQFRKFIDTLHSFPPLPRQIVGFSLIVLGIFGFLPIIGFWMIPLGLIVLSADYRFARFFYVNSRLCWRRFRRRYRSRNQVN